MGVSDSVSVVDSVSSVALSFVWSGAWSRTAGRIKITPANKKRSASNNRNFFLISCHLLNFPFLSARSALNTSHERYPGSQLGPGSLAAHGRFSLMLLHSCPDMVQRVPLRETKTSAPLTRGSFTRKYPRQNNTPAVADCRYRAPLSPRLCGPVKYTWMTTICQVSKTCQHHVISMIPTSFYQV